MTKKVKIIWAITLLAAFVIGMLVAKVDGLLIVIWGISLIVAFMAGMLVYRNNANKFQKLEEKAKSDTTIAAVIKNL